MHLANVKLNSRCTTTTPIMVLIYATLVLVMSCSSILDTGKSNSKYVRYSPEDLDRMLSEFFEGKARVDHRR